MHEFRYILFPHLLPALLRLTSESRSPILSLSSFARNRNSFFISSLLFSDSFASNNKRADEYEMRREKLLKSRVWYESLKNEPGREREQHMKTLLKCCFYFFWKKLNRELFTNDSRQHTATIPWAGRRTKWKWKKLYYTVKFSLCRARIKLIACGWENKEWWVVKREIRSITDTWYV